MCTINTLLHAHISASHFLLLLHELPKGRSLLLWRLVHKREHFCSLGGSGKQRCVHKLVKILVKELSFLFNIQHLLPKSEGCDCDLDLPPSPVAKASENSALEGLLSFALS